MTIYGLLVGIDKYQSKTIKQLSGCKNDVALFKHTLETKFKADPNKLLPLLDTQATKESIIQNFQSHLVDQVACGDTAIFYFSGHGSQSKTAPEFYAIEADGMDETLVCHDSRVGDVGDLRDKDIRYLVNQLAVKKVNITVIFDSCHGGHGTRILDDQNNELAGMARQHPADNKPGTLSEYYFSTEIKHDWSISKSLKKSAHILLAGCASHQQSQEQNLGEGWHGVFTYSLCETLNLLQHPVTYQELLSRTKAKASQHNLAQSPQIDVVGDDQDLGLQPIFGGKIQPLALTVQKDIGSGQWRLNAGAIQGFNAGDELAIYAEVQDRQNGKPLTLAQVAEARTSYSLLTLDQSDALDSIVRWVELPSGEEMERKLTEFSAFVTRKKISRLKVRLVGTDAALIQSIRQAFDDSDPAQNTPKRFIDLVDSGETAYAIHVEQKHYSITQGGDSRPLFTVVDTVDKAYEQIAVMARFHQKLVLDNPATSLLSDAVKVIIEHGGKTYENGEEVALSYTRDAQGKWQEPTFKMTLRLNDDYQGKPLACGVLFFDGATGDILTDLQPGEIWLSPKDYQLDGAVIPRQTEIKILEGIDIPLALKQEQYEQGEVQTRDFIKVLLCEERFDWSLLQQQGNQIFTRSSTPKGTNSDDLLNTLSQLLEDSHYRSLGNLNQVNRVVDWMSKTVPLTLIRPQETLVVDTQREQVLVENSNRAVRLQTHPSFSGSIRLGASWQHSLLDRSVDPLPTLELEGSEPYYFNDGARNDLGLDMLEVFWPANAKAETVTPEQPLVVATNQVLNDDEMILPYAYDVDAGLFIPLGFSEVTDDGTAIKITGLPTVAMTETYDAKSLGSALKIFFRKLFRRQVLKRDDSVNQLAIPVFSPDEPAQVERYITDTAAIRDALGEAAEQGQDVLLVVHGIIGETRTMAGFVNRAFPEDHPLHTQNYGAVLCFDYENLNTRIQDTANDLKQQLSDLGLASGTAPKLDIVAHSMGGLVSRYLIEQLQGDQFVRRLTMAGTPNNGSPYADIKASGYTLLRSWAYTNLAMVINGLTTAGVGSAASSSLLALMRAVDTTLDQMAPDSEFLAILQHSPEPLTDYVLLAGDTQMLEVNVDEQQSQLKQLLSWLGQNIRLGAYDVLTEWLFNEANDMAVGHSSMASFGDSWADDKVRVVTVKSDHLSYFG